MLNNKSYIYSIRHYYLAGFVIFIACFVSYSSMFKHDFIGYDDYRMIIDRVDKYDGINITNIDDIVRNDFPREEPLVVRDLSYLVNAQLFGSLNPLGYLVGNFCLHYVVSLLVFCLFLKIFPADLLGALLAAVFFVVHPVHVESVAWISSRKDTLYAAFFLAAFLCYLDYFKSCNLWNLVASFLLFFCALLSKAGAISFFPMIFLARVTLINKQIFTKKELVFYVLVGLATAWFITWYTGILTDYGVISAEAQASRNWTNWVFLNIEVMLFYLRQLVCPVTLSTFYDFPSPQHLFDNWEYLLLASSVVLFMCWTFIHCVLHKKRKVLFLLGWFLFALFPFLNLARVGISFADRYLYLASVAYCIAVGFLFRFLLSYLPERNRILRIIVVCLGGMFFAAFSVRTIKAVNIWESTGAFWENAMRAAPNSAQPYSGLMGVYIDYYTKYNGSPLAKPALAEARRLGIEAENKFCPQKPICSKKMGFIAPVLAQVYVLENDFKKADYYYRVGIQIYPAFYDARFSYIQFLIGQAKYEEALKHIQIIKTKANSVFYEERLNEINNDLIPFISGHLEKDPSGERVKSRD